MEVKELAKRKALDSAFWALSAKTPNLYQLGWVMQAEQIYMITGTCPSTEIPILTGTLV